MDYVNPKCHIWKVNKDDFISRLMITQESFWQIIKLAIKTSFSTAFYAG